MKKTMSLFFNDFKNENRTTFKQKLWAYKRGFTSSKIIEYGLNEENFKKYLSDLDYARLFPLNNEYRYWVNDKMTTKYILNKYNEHLPEYYYYLKGNRVLPQTDAPSKNDLTVNSVVELLKEKGKLAIKLEAGSLGVGFYKVEFQENQIYVNGDGLSEGELISLLNSLDGYLVTEFLEAHKDIAKIYPETANSLRLWVVKDGDSPSKVVYALLRFGTDKTGLIDNIGSGGMFSVVDLETGNFDFGYQKENGILKQSDVHPDTGMPVRGQIKDWHNLIDKVEEISDYIGQLSWMGFDVVVTDEGFKILEINSHHNITTYQSFQPLLEDSPASDFLNGKLKEKSIDSWNKLRTK